MENALQIRLFDFAVNVFNILKTLPDNQGYQVYKYQLIKCSSSSGANYEEAQAGSSRADFVNKVLISLKEMRESSFFLRLLVKTVDSQELISRISELVIESNELKLILGSIASKARRNIKS